MPGGNNLSIPHVQRTIEDGFMDLVHEVKQPFEEFRAIDSKSVQPVPRNHFKDYTINLDNRLPSGAASSPMSYHAILHYRINTNNDPLGSGGYSKDSKGAITRLYCYDANKNGPVMISSTPTDDNAKDNSPDSGIFYFPLLADRLDAKVIKIRVEMRGTYQTNNFLELRFLGFLTKHT